MPSRNKRKKSKLTENEAAVQTTESKAEKEDTNQVVTKKKEKRVKDPNHVHESKGQGKALKYLKLWYDDKKGKADQPWKFEKCRQIWLLQNCYNKERIPADDFKLFLKYAASIKGQMRNGAIGMFKLRKLLILALFL